MFFTFLPWFIQGQRLQDVYLRLLRASPPAEPGPVGPVGPVGIAGVGKSSESPESKGSKAKRQAPWWKKNLVVLTWRSWRS